MPPMNVLVLAVGGNVGQGILKALRHHPRPLHIIGADVFPLSMGLYTVEHAYISPWANDPAFVDWLITCCHDENITAILAGAEPVLMALATHRERIESETGAQCICSSREVLELGDDKLKTCQWLEASDLPFPAYADAANDQAVATLLETVGYPLLAKPRRGGGSHGVFTIEKAIDLDYARAKEDYLIQEFLGTDDEEYTVGCFRDRDGTLAPSCCMRRELVSGTTYRAVLGDFPAVRREAEAIVQQLAPEGPCNVQLRLTKRGPVCFEINPRFSGTTPIRSHFGYREVSAALDNLVEGLPVALPLCTEGIALRYWNELYVDPASAHTLESTGSLPEAHTGCKFIEDYGLPQK